MASLDKAQVDRVAALLRRTSVDLRPLTFCESPALYPPEGHPAAVEFFLFACVHQFGFWYGDDEGYVSRMQVPFDGKLRSGSETVWRLLKRQLDRDPTFFEPARLVSLSVDEFAHAFAPPDAVVRWPDFEVRYALTRRYGRWLQDAGLTAAGVVDAANRTPYPLDAFRSALARGPYGDDPLAKKAILAAMALTGRPERFLHADPDDPAWWPIVDYHVMRIVLRLGMVELPSAQRESNVRRAWVSAEEERDIRAAAFVANRRLIAESGLPMRTIDNLLWSAGRYCPDYKPPECDACLFRAVCPMRTELFQPTFRTTAY